VRVGLATARAIALAAGIPAVGVTAFAAVRVMVPRSATRARTLVVALESRRRDRFVHCVGPAPRQALAPFAVAPEGLCARLPAGPLLLAGNAVDRAAAALGPLRRDVDRLEPAGPDSRGVAAVAEHDRATCPPVPLYLRAPDARLPDSRP
jgi:tRNA threonylcarbamoyladenosine biosynthesis protein TsaB